MGLLSFATNGFAAMECRRESREGKVTGLVVKYLHRIISVYCEEPVQQYYEWQKGNMSVRSWGKEVKVPVQC